MTRHHQPHLNQARPVQNERNSLGKPQLFVQLSFGVSWSDRYVPRTHTISYTSQHLKNARDSGHFPRQGPSCQYYRRADSPPRQGHRGDHERSRSRAAAGHENLHPRQQLGSLSPPRESRADSRRSNGERGRSAPPAVHDIPWDQDGDEGGPSATLFPRRITTTATAGLHPPQVWKDLPTDPARFRLGEDGLPWSATAWPFEDDNDNNDDEDADLDSESPFANLPTTLPLSPSPRSREEEDDPQLVKELESLSTAMVTVDNGFENQWWNQGQRETTDWYPEVAEAAAVAAAYLAMGTDDANDDDVRPMSTADAVLLSAAEPPSSGMGTFSPISDDEYRDLVSPLSDFSPSFPSFTPLRRSGSTRSDELWMER